MDARPIGIFDSGVGGLTVAKEIHRLLPHESTIYVGDTARVPYGTKTPQQLMSYSREIIQFLLDKNVKAVVIACGTSSSITYEQMTKEFPALPLVDVIRPGVQACLQTKHTRFGLIATAATIKSGLFVRFLEEGMGCVGGVPLRPPGGDVVSRDAQGHVPYEIHARACPLFASMVEAGLPANHPALRFATETYLADLRGKIDTLVLGCTHYPLLTDALCAVLGDIEFINLGVAAAHAAKECLKDMPADESNIPTHSYYVSGPADVFRTTGRVILGEEIGIIPTKFTHN